MTVNSSLISSTVNPTLEGALREKLARRDAAAGSLGELEPLALRLGLIQNTLQPRLRDPQVALFASDHGLAIDGAVATPARGTAALVRQILAGQLPVSVFARLQSMELMLVDAGVAESLEPHPRLLSRKIAHGTRSARAGAAMSVEQAHAAIRAGMEIAGTLPGNAIACAGIGVGAAHSAALVLSRLGGLPVRDLIGARGTLRPEELARLLALLQGALSRHRDLADPVEVLAAYGGYDTAMMVGVMLVAASKRHLIVVDGLAACAALLVASRIAAPVTDYSLFTRSHGEPALDQALGLFQASALLELGMESIDGTGATLAWPLVRAAAALLTEVVDGDEPGPSEPAPMEARESR
jgi:nicotinate-nucleotide--dimethylbenzimidazole phosphoribosyltransferase